jgi:hypothetical protein
MRNLNRTGLAILVVLSLPTHAALAQKQDLTSGAFVSGNTLYKSCAGSIAGDREYCLAYVLGVSDAMELAIASGAPSADGMLVYQQVPLERRPLRPATS